METTQLLAPGEGESLDIMGAPMVVKAQGDGFFAGEQVVPPGYAVPPHSHRDDDEMLYVLEGCLTLSTDAGEVAAPAGTCAWLPRGSRHGFRNDTGQTARFLAIALPGVQTGEMFHHFDRAGRQAAGGLEPAAIGAIAGQYGVAIG